MSFDAARPGVSQDVAIGVASVQATNAISTGVSAVRMVATSACYVATGANPTATKPGGFRLAPSFPEIFRVYAGEKVAVIQDAAGGTLTITEMSS
jgi:hypothetical protein